MEKVTGLPRDEARALQKGYYHEHGTTLAGLMAHHGVDPQAFLDEVHEVSMDRLVPDLELRAAVARLPGRRLVFTNGGSKHAERVLDRLNLNDLFEDSEKNLKPAFDIGMTTIMVGPKAEASSADFVHHRTRHLTPFLNAALIREAA